MGNFKIGGIVLMAIFVLIALCPEFAFAQFAGGGALQSKVSGITNGLTHFLLPAVSVLGIVYAAILAATGDASAKSRMVLVLVASIVGFLAPLIIGWLQGLAS
jgi:hypothetical protein